ncbi:TetR/AcrR family transcriptional regulator [Methylocapsa palsarum]|uniref:TetR/AcrR family transcriptional regulator, mexJK operon transcriptional repressor n=1 Tax=Methylocapsa palsarum TaxID=1612308 RepID=A0A1I3Z1B7_9HYPH|nr:TetR/AcrR family transcriptional regulator [Methylocapsa palsarum]SFK37825.1 TetR/AcrR family transcriptional regulator, mexJK operon transcriptional repressor [Methylocapsa palsarum]
MTSQLTVQPFQPRDDPKEESILGAAKEAFMELGYAATSMDLVAQRAHASKTTLYKRFPSKEALFSACIAAECEARGMNFPVSVFEELPVDQALAEIGSRLLDLLWSSEAIRMEQIVSGEAARFPEVAHLYFEAGPNRVCEAMTEYFEAAAKSGKLAVAKPRFAAEQFVASLKSLRYAGIVFGHGPKPAKQERDAFVVEAVALFLDGARPR